MSRAALPLVVAAALGGGAAYWRHASPYSQALGHFPLGATADPSAPTLALSFDDGPNEPYTSRLADVLADRGVPGTFFQVGRCVERHPGLTRALADAGHVIGNHSYSHQWQRGWRATEIRDEVDRADDVIAAELGRRPLLYRPPWLLRSPDLFRVMATRGLQPVSGEFAHPLEPWQPTPERIFRRAARRSRSGRILIFHDGYDARGGNRANTVEAVARLIDDRLERGYAFTTVDRLLGISAYADAVSGGLTSMHE
jgi:peptidoglycan/xylan/chitin deacetylase (PgdA/CDA1 family)